MTNTIDAKRDVRLEPFIMVDGTDKNPKIDKNVREWPPEVVCDEKTLKDLMRRGVLDIDEEFIKRFGLL